MFAFGFERSARKEAQLFRMQHSDSVKRAFSDARGFPLTLFVVAFVVSISTTCVTLWQSREIELRGEELGALHVKLVEHVGRIMEYDETLTMSARLCAATGDFEYEHRYKTVDPKLTQSIHALRSFVPTAEIAELVATTDDANSKLVDLEVQSFALTHAGRGPEGMSLLGSSEYSQLKAAYAAGMTKTTSAAQREMGHEYSALRQRGRWLMFGSTMGVVGLVIAWVSAVRSARAWVTLRSQAEVDRHRNLEAVSREKDEFLATISHSLKTPLNHILGFAELLKDGRVGTLSSQQQVFVDDIYNAGRGQLSAVDSLIELAEVQISRVQVKATPQNPSDLLREIARAHHSDLHQAGLTLEVEEHEDLGLVPLDARAISRMVGVLIKNACQFTPAGGKVALAARRVDRADVGAPVRSDVDSYLQFSVNDSGAGIAPDVLRRLFRPFSQGDGRLARTHQGTGIGLALVKKTAEFHGGGCAVTSELGKGSTFFVWLPLSDVT